VSVFQEIEGQPGVTGPAAVAGPGVASNVRERAQIEGDQRLAEVGLGDAQTATDESLRTVGTRGRASPIASITLRCFQKVVHDQSNRRSVRGRAFGRHWWD
jgi:hypothetical protein